SNADASTVADPCEVVGAAGAIMDNNADAVDMGSGAAVAERMARAPAAPNIRNLRRKSRAIVKSAIRC
ncbi:MAG TPA: hypothetical protein VN018_05085, partial [Brevundimonas sp.]|nr:hypothetical protein [Brevundimonas sp.]